MAGWRNPWSTSTSVGYIHIKAQQLRMFFARWKHLAQATPRAYGAYRDDREAHMLRLEDENRLQRLELELRRIPLIRFVLVTRLAFIGGILAALGIQSAWRSAADALTTPDNEPVTTSPSAMDRMDSSVSPDDAESGPPSEMAPPLYAEVDFEIILPNRNRAYVLEACMEPRLTMIGYTSIPVCLTDRQYLYAVWLWHPYVWPRPRATYCLFSNALAP